MPELRAYDDLATLLTYETDTRDPHQAAIDLVAGIARTSPNFKILVLFVGPDPNRPWIMLPVPSEAIRNLSDAAISLTGDGRHPVAYWKRS